MVERVRVMAGTFAGELATVISEDGPSALVEIDGSRARLHVAIGDLDPVAADRPAPAWVAP